ncbi:MAG TPA: amidase [Micromonosporaceae bacterium]|nr:amidase [Micromonosporaceae bacterium]
MTQLHELTALEQAIALRRREVSAVELVEHYLARIEAAGDRVGAYVTVTGESARDQAGAADEVLRDGGEGLSPLHGVPIAIKDLTMTAGVRTTFGSAAFADFVPPVDADVVRLLREAGTISLGKTTTSEFGISLHAEGLVAPPARNPWAPEHTAGGSSGGSAAAVAAGLVPIAHGNDGGGSVRIPASICGLVGFKPSRGLVSNGPVGSAAFGLPTNGCLGRTVADVAALLDAMAVPQLGEPLPAPARPDGGFLPAALRPDAVPPLKVGRFTAPMLADVQVHPACLDAVELAARALAAAGHEVIDVPGLLDQESADRFVSMWAALAVQAPVPADREGELLPLTRWIRELGAALPVPRLMQDLGMIQAGVRRALRDLADVDILLCPTLAAPQAKIGYFTETGDPAEDFERQKRFSPYCAAYNVTGQPAVSLPVGRTTEGFPVGAMLAAGVGEDALLLAVAAQVEQATAGGHPAPWRATASATVNLE